MSYDATLTNPLPAGEIESQGRFGPWRKDNPGLTPLSGTYTFTHARLDSFRGLSGILFSKGQFAGPLDRIDVQGETTTPDFSLGLNGHPMPLNTVFHAIVDGATGNTILEHVRAKLANSEIIASGGVYRVPGQKYRRILLDALSKNAKLEDFLRLALKADKPPMTGAIDFRTRIDIPPESAALAERLRLDGHFDISSARFAELNVQKKLAALSRRGEGETAEQSPGSVASNFASEFTLRAAVMIFSNLTFAVPGASVHLNGTYGLRSEVVDFRGTLGLQARLAQMTRAGRQYSSSPWTHSLKGKAQERCCRSR